MRSVVTPRFKSRAFGKSARRAGGFTLVELLVVIGIIALLVGILLPALNKARRQAQIVKCSANLHNVGLAMLNYASQNKGSLPLYYASDANGIYRAANPLGTAFPTGAGNWMWDMQVTVRNALIRYGCARSSFYCPSNDAQNANALWNFSVTATINGSPVNLGTTGTDPGGNSYDSWPLPDETGFFVAGYIFLVKRLDGAMAPSAGAPNGLLASPDNRNKHFDWQAHIKPHNTVAALDPVVKYVRPNISSNVEIAFDAMICDGNNIATPNFGAALGGWNMGGNKIPHQSAHWYGTSYNNGYPVGGNYLCLDGHVEWRPISKVTANQFGNFNERVIIGSPPIAFWW
jgi:prepilin-type N-terminal cleavage/methylation domain-containing protein